jgi:hypothetical protein
VAVDVRDADRAAGVAQPGKRTRDQRAAAAEHQRARTGRRDVAHGGSHGLRGGHDVIDSDHPGRRVTVIAAYADVEVAAIVGPEAGGQIPVAQRSRRELGPTGPPD